MVNQLDDNWGDVIRKSGVDLLIEGKAKSSYGLRSVVLDSQGQPISTTNPVPVVQVEPGLPQFFDDGRDTTPGVEQTLWAATVPAAKLWRLKNLVIISRFQAQFQLLADGAPIAGGRTGAACPVAPFAFLPYREMAADVELELLFMQHGETPVAWVETYVQYEELDQI